MISQAVEYSLRAMVMLANAGEEPLTVQKIAATAKIPAPYLSKLMQGLLRAELVHSRRGVGGGFTLGRAAKEITVWDIVQAVDPIKRILACPLGITGHVRLCPLHRRLDQAMALVEEAFRKSSLADVLADSSPAGGPLCREKSPLVPLGLKLGRSGKSPS